MDYKLNKMKLNKKLILSLVSLIIIVIIVIAISINSTFNKKFEQYIIKNNEQEVSDLVDSIKSKYIDGKWEADEERLNSVNEEVIRLTNLVNQLQNLSKFDSEKSKLNLMEFDIDNLIRNIVYNNQREALEKNIKIVYDLENINSCLDKEKITQVIVNLLSNAIRYTNYGGEIYINLYKANS